MIPIDAACPFGCAHAQEPRIHRDGKGVKDRGLAGRVVADKEIEVRIELNPAPLELLEILDR